MRILVTGSEGLIGRRLCRLLHDNGTHVEMLDIAAPPSTPAYGDILNAAKIQALAAQVDGIIHLAGCSRVVWGERAPEHCMKANVEGTRNILNAALASPKSPWVIYASSREVYGEQQKQPVAESAALLPINTYGRSKYEAERLVEEAAAQGLKTGICRFSNVFGAVHDHQDRVVPAFISQALKGIPLTVEDGSRSFDFTYIEDVIQGIQKYAVAMQEGEKLPAIHFVTGVGTTLQQLAELIVEKAGTSSAIAAHAGRSYDVRSFIGNPDRARKLLGWEASTSLHIGLENLIAEKRQAL